MYGFVIENLSPSLDKGIIKAYKATGSNKVASDLFALICDKSLTPRHVASIKYSKVINPNLAKLVASGKILWPEAKQERFCFVFENTLGRPVLDGKKSKDNLALGLKAEEVMENIAYPMINILLDLRDKDLVHGEIYPGNMFYNGAASGEKIKLGECLSAPVSSQLPALYEPIERALADPIARGIGTFADDLYSFGVSLAVMLRTSDPVQSLSDEQIIERKVEKGSYATLINDRLSGATLELLRGLLYDDPSQRWTLDDVQAWMDGRRLSPKQSPKRIKATRPLILHNKKYIRPELLAKDMCFYPDESAKLVENGELQQWIDRAIEDKAIKLRMEQVMQDVAAYDRGSGYNESLCSAISTTLYTECPVRYGGLSFIPEGFGKALSSAYVLKKDMQPYIDVLKHPFVIQSIRNKKNVDTSSLLTKFDSCRAFISQTAINTGLERCIYFLDPESPCLSSILDKYYVQTPEELMDAFEGVCSSSEPSILFDRHVVSFLSVKDRKNIDPYMSDLGSSEPYKRVLAQLRTLATIQKRSRLGKFPALAGWVSRHLHDVYERFHDVKKQEELAKDVNKLVKAGDLTKIALLFEDPKLYQSDVGNFYQAMEEYRRIDHEKKLIETKLKDKKTYGQKTGRQIASVVSMVVSAVIILMTAYTVLMQG